MLAVSFFFELPSRPSRLRPIAHGPAPGGPSAEPTAELTSRYSDVAPRARRRHTDAVDARAAGEEAIAELDALGADCLPPLKAHVGMTRAAEDHVEDLVRTKRLGHTGSDGSAPAQRLNRHGRWFERASECLSHGRRTAVAAVAQMIIDDGVASRAQRRGLLSDRARAVGCALRMHPRHGAVCCVTLAGGYGPPPLKEARKVVADAVNLPDDFEEVLFSVPVVDIHDRVYQALERGGKVVLDYAPGALKLSVWDAAGKGEKFAVDWDPGLWEV